VLALCHLRVLVDALVELTVDFLPHLVPLSEELNLNVSGVTGLEGRQRLRLIESGIFRDLEQPFDHLAIVEVTCHLLLDKVHDSQFGERVKIVAGLLLAVQNIDCVVHVRSNVLNDFLGLFRVNQVHDGFYSLVQVCFCFVLVKILHVSDVVLELLLEVRPNDREAVPVASHKHLNARVAPLQLIAVVRKALPEALIKVVLSRQCSFGAINKVKVGDEVIDVLQLAFVSEGLRRNLNCFLDELLYPVVALLFGPLACLNLAASRLLNQLVVKSDDVSVDQESLVLFVFDELTPFVARAIVA